MSVMSVVDEKVEPTEGGTTTRISEEFDYASLESRFFANIIDNLAILAAIVVPVFIAGGSGSNALSGLMLLLGVGFGIFYLLILEGVWSGQTLGKKALGIRVVGRDETEIGILQSFVRNFVGGLGHIFGWVGLLVGAVSIYRSDRNQRVGDKAASTIVVKT